MGLVRMWRASLTPGQCDGYDRFAREVSLPMFAAQQGLIGLEMMRNDTEFRFAKIDLAHWEQLPKEIGILSRIPSLPPGPLSFMIQIFAGRSAPLELFMDCRNALPARNGEELRLIFGFYLDESLQDNVRAHLLIGGRPQR